MDCLAHPSSRGEKLLKEDPIGVGLEGCRDTPLVSVILPVYNAEQFIAKTIESALNQTYPNLEVIVVDDGSMDSTRTLLEQFTDPRLRVISQANAGVARARNRAVMESKGEFIAPLDADDLWDPRKIELQVRRIQEYGDRAGLVYCWWVWIDEKGVVLDRSPDWRVEGNAFELLYQVNFTGNASVPLYRREALRHIGGYDESFEAQGCRGCEDWDLALRVASRYEVALTPELLVGYRRLPDSMSSQIEVMSQSQRLLSSKVTAGNPTLPQSVSRRSSDQFLLYIAGLLFRSGRYAESLRYALRTCFSPLFWRVLPYIVFLFIRRLIRRAPPQVMQPGSTLKTSDIPAALIPYARIYSTPAQTPVTVPERLLRSAFLQGLVMILAFAYVFWLHVDNDGLWFQGDSPRHAINGLFWLDALRANTIRLREFALSYYARYPVINPVAYPPLFYVLEGLGFSMFGASPSVGKVLVLSFSILAGCYTMIWARRWVSAGAGWTGAFFPFVPGVMIWSNTIMLNIPATAFDLIALYYFRRWCETRDRKKLAICILSTLIASLTYYPGAIAAAVIITWLVLGRAPDRTALVARIGALAFSASLVVLPALVAAAIAPEFVRRNIPGLRQLLSFASWKFYPVTLPTLLGTYLLLLTVAGLGLALGCAATRSEVRWLAAWILSVLAVFSLLPAKDSRYILLTIPAALIAVALGVSSSRWFHRVHPALRLALLIGALGGAAASASSLQIPAKHGFRAAAAYLRREAPRECVLYDGYHDGLFSFYYRALDPGFEGRVALGQQYFYHYGPANSFDWVERHIAASSQDIIDLLRSNVGCRWVAIEIGSASEWARGQRLLRSAVLTKEFELVRSFPLIAPNAERIDLYRLRSGVASLPLVKIPAVSFLGGVSIQIAPISR